MAENGWTVVVRGGRQNKDRGESFPVPTPTRSTRYNWRNHHRTMRNDARGDCWILSLLQDLLVEQGVPPSEAELALTRDGKRPGTIEKLNDLMRVFRMLTVATFNADRANLVELFGLDQEQSAFTDEDIRKLATSRGSDIKSVIDWINCILLCSSDETMGGWADDQTIVLMAKIIGIPNFALVRPVVANGGDRILQSTSAFSAAVNDRANMVLIHGGHCEAIAPIDVSFFSLSVFRLPQCFLSRSVLLYR